MQSLLTESFNRNKKPISKQQRQQEEDDEQEEQSKHEEEEQDDFQDNEPDAERKKSESQQSLEAMKDAFESDDSYLLITEELRDERFGNEIHGSKNAGLSGQNGGNSHNFKIKKIAKRRKDFQWKYLWVKQENAVQGSKSLWLKKWVKVKALHQNTDSLEAIPSEKILNGTTQTKQN